MEEKVSIVKLYNGDMIIGKVSTPDIESTSQQQVWGKLCLKDPRQVVIIPTMAGDIKIALTSLCHPFKVKRIDDEVYINQAQILCTIEDGEIDKDLVNSYLGHISGIAVASSSDMATFGNGDGPGEFTL